MSKNRRKASKEHKQSASTPVNIVLPDSMSAEEMQQIITNALLAVEDAKEQKAKEQKEQDRKIFREAMGYKDYPHEKGLKRSFLVFCNRVKMLFKLFFAPKHLIKGDDATFGLLKMSIEIFFWVAKWAATLFTVCAIAYIPLQYIVEAILVLPIMSNVLLGCFALSSFLLSRMFRMASIEVDKIEDRSLLFGIFASVASIVSIVIAIVAILK